ncbi:mitogen-activated protein kinase kinase kinase anp1 [Phtheirospermum japonicum]|uniref:Mitogen-activated protein kinase kinase kinase anp1 n=1 Tax=Phtheirospermum japonicum TaxID=374723 RepID=A0A830BVJ2_9LAMI|nr:mitogen-activated protein kinase kinase kinase anp1 [Phtheirospermum japonicum]
MAGFGKDAVNEYGDGVAWFRGPIIGKGSFGRVYKATLKNSTSKYSCFPSVMAVKSAEVSCSGTIQKEREVMSNLNNTSPYLIKCFGDETTMGENGVMAYNLLLEYGSGGTLADRIEKSGGNGLPELEVRVHTRSVLRGLNHIHGFGYVHCDLKPDNILLLPNGRKGANITEFSAKIGDFGLAKRQKDSKKRKLEPYWRGTPMYLSPETVIDSAQAAPSDVWAVGCIVLEMLTGKPAWDEKNAEGILAKIGAINELPKIPGELSKDARDFLKCCFVRKSMYRFTCEMLLNHPFVDGLGIDDEDLEDFEYECSDESEEDSFSCWSEEDADVGFSSSTAAGFDQSNEMSKQIFSQSVSKRRQHCPASFSIPAAI